MLEWDRSLGILQYILNSSEAANLYRHKTTMKLIFFKLWPDKCETVESWDQLVTLMSSIEEYREQQLESEKPMFVMSK